MLLIGRTPAAVNRSASHAGDGPIVTSASAAAYRPHPGSPTETGIPAGPSRLAPLGASFRARSNAVAASRDKPYTLKQSGRFAVISKSITSPSIDATSNPHAASLAATSFGLSVTAT